MKQLLLIAAAGFIPGLLFAQEKEKNKEVEQIFITQKGGINKKLKIEIDGDEITVDGKPISESDSNIVSVKRLKIKDPNSFGGANIKQRRITTFGIPPMRPKTNKAMLGVLTEPIESGLIIIDVREESAAEKAGLKIDDIITSVNDKKVTNSDDLYIAFQDKNPGDKVKIEYTRDGRKSSVIAELTSWKPSPSLKSLMQDDAYTIPRLDMDEFMRQIPQNGYREYGNWNLGYPPTPVTGPKLGVKIQDVESGSGVKIIEVQKGSDADKSGIREGDIVKEANGKEIKGTDDMAAQARSTSLGGVLKLKIERNGRTQNIDIQVRKKIKTTSL